MPIYDYRCDACGHAFSAVQSYQDETLDICPQCGAVPRKLMTSPAIVFKGSGWYKTDSRRGSSDAKADAKADGKSETTGSKPATTSGKSGSTSESKSDSTSGSKSEATPATTPEAKSEAKKEPAS